MYSHELKTKLNEGHPVYGTLITSNSPRWIEVTAGLGLDYVFIDTEHVALDRLTLSWMCQAYKAAGLPPIVRIPSPDPYEASMALDGGAAGIVAPYVETVDQVQQLRGAVKLRPMKGHRLHQIISGKEVAGPTLDAYLSGANSDNMLIINIESVPAMENLDAMLQIPGLDAVLVGPHDLSCSLGIPEQYTNPKFESAVEHIIRTARSHSVGAGVHMFYDNMEHAMRWIRAGANLIMHSGDIIAYARGIKRDIDALRNAGGDIVRPKGEQKINI